jgi:TonB-linked SusC/RagA family outer membrane protein
MVKTLRNILNQVKIMKNSLLRKTMLMSRLTLYGVVLQLLFLNFVIAGKSSAQQKSIYEVKLSISVRSEGLTEVFSLLESKTGFYFTYNEVVIDPQKVVNLNFKNETLADILNELAKQSNLKFKRINQNIHVYKMQQGDKVLEELDTNLLQQKTIQGKVTSLESTDGLPGVNVVEKGTSNGTVTDVDGNYRINVNEGAVLVFSSVGFTTEEIAIGNRSVIDLVMAADIQQLQELVVVGYGTQAKRDVTGSVASISAESLKDLPVASITESLSGQMAGVQIQQTSGAPGSGLTVRVRGTGSISAGNSPLYVVDGYPLGQDNISMINPNDIESIDVLKDASAAAIYGSRGANGVVLITTKRGKAGKPKISLDVFGGIQEVPTTIDMLNGEQFADLGREAFNNAWIDRGGSASDPNDARPNNERLRIPDHFTNPALRTDTDWQDEIFRVAAMQNYQVSISGGNETSRYLISGNYFNQDGIVENSNFKRFSFRANVDADLSKKITVGLNLAPSVSFEKRPPTDGHWASDGAVNASLAILPSLPVYNEDGSYAMMASPGYGLTGFGLPGVANPVAFVKEINNDLSRLRLLGNVYAEWEIMDGLTFKTTFGSDLNTERINYFRPSIVPSNQQVAPTIPRGNTESFQDINWLNENTLNYTKTFGEQHTLNALLGYSVQKASFERSRVNADNYPNDLVETVNAGVITGGNFNIEEWSLISYLGRVNYDFANKYLITATIRRDGSSRFGSGNRWGVFPSGSIGWRVSEESFMSGIRTISDLKLRASYGLTGNNLIPNYGAIGLLGSADYVFGAGTGSLANGLAPTTITNLGLSWETTRQLNVGIDLGILQDRLFLMVDHYVSNTSDLLLNVPVPTSTGFSTALQNIGEVRNTGWEFTLNANTVSTSNFDWDTDFNISFNRNEVLALGPLGDPIRSGSGIGETHITIIGEPIGNFFGYIQEGVYLNQQDLDNSPRFPNSRPGDVKYKDVDGDGALTPNDRTNIGNNQPDFIWGFTNRLSYKNFDLNFILQGVQGGEILNLSSRFISNLEGNQNQRAEVLNRWKSPQEPGDGKIPRANSRTTGNNNSVSTRWVEDGSFMRIRNLTIGYNLPQDLASNLKLSGARVYLGIQNLATFTDYRGYNPEVNLGGDQALTPGTDYGGFPLARTYTLGVNLNF